MGSIGQAIMAGFICRLCSKQKKVVIHLYTARAKKLDLMNKIKLLPISVGTFHFTYSLINQARKTLHTSFFLLHKNSMSSIQTYIH